MNNGILNRIIFMVVFVVFGFSSSAFANMAAFNGNFQESIIDVSLEGKNLADFESLSVNHENRESNKAQVGLLDVSPEGKNPLNIKYFNENHEGRVIASRIVDTKDMRDTTGNYGIGPEWGNAKDKESWYDLNILGR